MKLVFAHARAELLNLRRTPAFTVPALGFPVMLYLFFGLPVAREHPEAANFLLGSWSVYAALGAGFYLFGVGVAIDRENPWSSYLRILPAGPMPFFAGKVIVAFLFALASILALWVVAFIGSAVELSIIRMLALLLALAAGVVPMILFGIAIGYAVPAKAAVAVANLFFLPMSYAGGLWMLPEKLPALVQKISWFMPTRHAGEIAWWAVGARPFPLISFIAIAGFIALFTWLALLAYRREEKSRFV